MPATILGGPGEMVTGTPGDDVIVGTSTFWVDAGDGDDAICLVGQIYAQHGLDGGAGDDWVDTRAADGGAIFVDLGPGGDVFVGGWAREVVSADEDTSAVDELQLFGILGGGGGLGGGAGRDRLAGAQDSWVVDNRTQVISDATGRETPLTGFHVFGFSGRTIFTGGPQGERVEAAEALTANMGAGDDRVRALGDLGSMSGGIGSDYLIVGERRRTGPPRGRVRVDMRRGHGSILSGGQRDGFGLEVDHLTVAGFRKVRVLGDARANRLTGVQACSLRMSGGGGADVLAVRSPACGRPASVLAGQSGDDRLVGAGLRDLLYGGAGRDLADGKYGTDRCVAEVRRNCEQH